MARITLSNLAHSYLPNPAGEDDWALKQMDLAWENGQAYALLGASGGGKSTLLNISGLLIPTRGRVLFNDTDVTRAPTHCATSPRCFSSGRLRHDDGARQSGLSAEEPRRRRGLCS